MEVVPMPEPTQVPMARARAHVLAKQGMAVAVWDSYLMGYASGPAGRGRQVTAADYARVYDKSGNATSTVIVDGMAAGVWELDPDAGRITVAPFDDVAMRWADVEAEAAAICAAIGTDLDLERAGPPGPLSAGPRNAFLSPISLCPPATKP
jgi:hypothetical protein